MHCLRSRILGRRSCSFLLQIFKMNFLLCVSNSNWHPPVHQKLTFSVLVCLLANAYTALSCFKYCGFPWEYNTAKKKTGRVLSFTWPPFLHSSWMRTYATTSQGLIKFLTKAYVEWYKFDKAAGFLYALNGKSKITRFAFSKKWASYYQQIAPATLLFYSLMKANLKAIAGLKRLATYDIS